MFVLFLVICVVSKTMGGGKFNVVLNDNKKWKEKSEPKNSLSFSSFL